MRPVGQFGVLKPKLLICGLGDFIAQPGQIAGFAFDNFKAQSGSIHNHKAVAAKTRIHA